jgi:hypothetical protein
MLARFADTVKQWRAGWPAISSWSLQLAPDKVTPSVPVPRLQVVYGKSMEGSRSFATADFAQAVF